MIRKTHFDDQGCGLTDTTDAGPGGDPLEWAVAAKLHIAQERVRNPGYTQRAAAQVLGIEYTALSHGLRMVRRLREPARDALRVGGLTLGHAKALTAFDGAEQDAMVERLVQQRASVREAEETAASRRPGPKTAIRRGRFKRDHDLAHLEDRIAAVTGVPTTIEYAQDKRRGRVVMAFADRDGFDTILGRLGVAIDPG